MCSFFNDIVRYSVYTPCKNVIINGKYKNIWTKRALHKLNTPLYLAKETERSHEVLLTG